jgi:hypothetical protein
MKWFVGGGILAALVIAVLVVIDVTATPPPVAPGRCTFQNNLILPDRCLSSCPGGVDCPTAMTRPYFVFWTEAAGCPDAVICAKAQRKSGGL